MKYEWRFDKRGRRTTAPVAAPATQAPRTARGPLEEFEAVQHWIAQHPGSGVDLPTLETMRVIPAPPTWSYVQALLQKARTNESQLAPEARAEVEEEAAKYLEALRQNAEPLESAIYSATVLSAFQQEGGQDPIVGGLQLLEFSLSRGRTREERLRILKIVWDKLVAEFALAKDVHAGRALLPDGDIEGWLDAVTTAQKRVIDKVRASEKNQYDAAKLAWSTWRNWALQVWPTPPKLSEIDIWNLATRMAGWPPGWILSDDPTSMTISAWTTALHAALTTNRFRDHAREWFVPFALVQLGFVEQAQFALLRQWNPESHGPLSPQAVPDEFRRFVNQIPQSSTGRCSLVIMSDYGTRASQWLPWNEMGCLAYRLPSLADLTDDLRRLFPEPKVSYVFFAFPGVPSPDETQQALDAFRGLFSRSDFFKGASAVLMGEYPIARETPLPFYYLETPPSLEEAVRHLDSVPTEALRSRETQQEKQS